MYSSNNKSLPLAKLSISLQGALLSAMLTNCFLENKQHFILSVNMLLSKTSFHVSFSLRISMMYSSSLIYPLLIKHSLLCMGSSYSCTTSNALKICSLKICSSVSYLVIICTTTGWNRDNKRKQISLGLNCRLWYGKGIW